MDTEVHEKTMNTETIDTEVHNEIESHVICQFTFHPPTGEISLEAAEDIDVFDLIKCKRILDEQIDNAEAQFKMSVLQSQQQTLVKLNAALEGLREVLKDVVSRKQTVILQPETKKRIKLN